MLSANVSGTPPRVGAYENTWPRDRVIPLDGGSCGWQSLGSLAVYGYRVVNTTTEPMAFWVAKPLVWLGQPATDEKTWWTVNPGEEIRFNVLGGAALHATTAEAYTACQPDFMVKTVQTQNLAPVQSHVQVQPRELVRYTPSEGGGAFVVYRDKELRRDVDLFTYPNYFGVGLAPKSTTSNGTLTYDRYSDIACF